MKLLLAILLFTSLSHAETFLFRQKIEDSDKETKKAFFDGKGSVDSKQPFYNTYVLPTADVTNYYLIKITPSTDEERDLMLSKFGKSDLDLYQRYEITYDGLVILEDNSALFPLDTDYSVKESSK